VFVRAQEVPGTGYRLITQPARVRAVLEDLEPDVLEVHDRTTLRGLGAWANSHGVAALVVSHERLDRWLQQWLPGLLPLRRFADRTNATLMSTFDTVVCTTAWAGEEFTRLGARNLRLVPLGVDLAGFRPRLSPVSREVTRLAMVSRLSREKRPDLAVETVRELVRRGRRVELVVAGDGPMFGSLVRQAAGLPVTFLGHVRDRGAVASMLADADVLIAPGPVETFGLAALEALACGTPVVVNHRSALPEVVGTRGGRSCAGSGYVIADTVLELLSQDQEQLRRLARRRAEAFTWDTTVEAFLAVHDGMLARVPA
jgi:alpha-1,6-mannosyltransferase